MCQRSPHLFRIQAAWGALPSDGSAKIARGRARALVATLNALLGPVVTRLESDLNAGDADVWTTLTLVGLLRVSRGRSPTCCLPPQGTSPTLRACSCSARRSLTPCSRARIFVHRARRPPSWLFTETRLTASDKLPAPSQAASGPSGRAHPPRRLPPTAIPARPVDSRRERAPPLAPRHLWSPWHAQEAWRRAAPADGVGTESTDDAFRSKELGRLVAMAALIVGRKMQLLDASNLQASVGEASFVVVLPF